MFNDRHLTIQGGAAAEWSKTLHVREEVSENQKDPRFTPLAAAIFKKIKDISLVTIWD